MRCARMEVEVFNFLDCHIETQRAKKAKRVPIKSTSMKVEQEMIFTQEYQLCFPYFKVEENPIFIRLGYKNHRVCIRISDRAKTRLDDFYCDSLDHLKDFTRELVTLSKLYQRTTWFVRAQLIPSIFSVVRSLLVSHSLLLK